MVTTVVAAILAKPKNKMFSLKEIIEKLLHLRESFSVTSPPNPNATPKTFLGVNFLPKTTTKRWNQANLSYFDPHYDRVYKKDDIVLVKKDIYYKDFVLFVQHLVSLLTFQSAALVKFIIATSLQGSTLE